MILLLKVVATIGLMMVIGMIIKLTDYRTKRETVVGYGIIGTVNVLAIAAIWAEEFTRCVT